MQNQIRKLYAYDPGRFIDTIAVPWETDYAALVPRFTGGLSAISSGLIIYVILRSQTRLSSVYHRIMFGMSLADICGSIAMALTSLPMPSYMSKEEIFGYSWAGTRLGNTYTCDAQGFFATFGMVCMFNYNAMLCVYYACAIAFMIKEKNIKKYAEPFIHGIPIVTSLGFALMPLFYELYNPGISGFAWCGPQTYPDECSLYDGIEGIRGNVPVKKLMQIFISIILMCDFACILLSLGMVVYKVIQMDRVMKQLSNIYKNCNHTQMAKVLQRHRNTKAVIFQASSYIAAFAVGVIPPGLLSVGAIHSSGQNGHELADFFEKLMLVLLPLQGFFNCVIFVLHKVYNYRRVHHDVSTCRVLHLLFCSSAHEPFFISRISVVKQYEEDDEEAKVAKDDAPPTVVKRSIVYELDVQDESNQELHYHLGLMNKNHNDDTDLNVIMVVGHSIKNCDYLENLPSGDNHKDEGNKGGSSPPAGRNSDQSAWNDLLSLCSSSSSITRRLEGGAMANNTRYSSDLSLDETSIMEEKQNNVCSYQEH